MTTAQKALARALEADGVLPDYSQMSDPWGMQAGRILAALPDHVLVSRGELATVAARLDWPVVLYGDWTATGRVGPLTEEGAQRTADILFAAIREAQKA